MEIKKIPGTYAIYVLFKSSILQDSSQRHQKSGWAVAGNRAQPN